jgi:hypothetical protein
MQYVRKLVVFLFSVICIVQLAFFYTRIVSTTNEKQSQWVFEMEKNLILKIWYSFPTWYIEMWQEMKNFNTSEICMNEVFHICFA